jgi:lipopolysaccharide export system protein LptA
MTYGGTPPAVTASYSAFAGSDTVNSLTTPPTCTTAATSSTPVGTDTGANTCSGAVDGNYNFTYVPGNVTVGKASLTITASSGTMTYGGTPPAVTASYSAFAGSDTVNSLTTAPTCTTTASSSTPAGTDTGANTCSGAVDPNYSFTYVPGNVTVGKASLTITASSTSMTYGGTPPAVSASYSAFAGSDTVNSLTTAPTCTTTATSSTPAGTDTGANTCSGAVDPNYSFTYVPGNVTVGKASLTITASSTSMTYGGTPPAVTASYSAFAGSDTVNSLTTAPTCTTAASSSTPAGTDTGANTCSGAVDGNYNFTYVPGNVTVGKASLTITASSTSMTYGGTPPAVTASYSAFAGSDTVNSLTTAPTCVTAASSSTPAGTDTGANTCSGAVDGNYNFTYVPGNVTVGKASLTITASSTSMTYGGTPPAVTASYSAFAGSDTVNSLTTAPTCTTTVTSSTPAGTDTGANTCSGAVDGNYNFTYVPGDVTVGKASLSITASSTSMTYGAANPGFTYTMTGFVNGDTQASATTGAPSLSTTATAASPVGPYPIAAAAGTLAATNYSFAFVNGTLTVNQATPVITWATPAAITYGTALSATQLDASSAVGGTFAYSPATGTVPTAGSQTLSVTFTPSDTTDYTTATQTVSLTVSKATPTITWATPAPITYGATLSSTQLNATASAPGTFVYSPAAGTTPAAGTDTLSVTFTPSDTTDYNTATATVTLAVADFTFTPPSGSSTSATAAPGQSATYTLSVGGEGGLSGTMTFTCTGAPSEATCTVLPNPLTVGSSATNVTVSVTTTAPSVSAPRSRPLPPAPPLSPGLRGLLMLALALAAMAWAVSRRNQPGVSRWESPMVPLAGGLLLALALAGCGGGGGGGGGGGTTHDPGTPAGTYTLTVTGTTGSGSSALSHSVTLTLTVS